MKSKETESTSQNNADSKNGKQSAQGAAQKRVPIWSAAAAAVGGAVVVGAVWGGVALHSSTGNHVIAKVGSTTITKSQLVNKLESAGGMQTLQQMIDNQLIKDGAKKYKITATQKEIQSALSNLEAQYGISTTSQLNSLLQQNNMQLSDLTSALKLQVLERKLSERNAKVTNQEIQSYYNANKSQFTKTGSSKPQPLSAVKSQVISAVKQSQAIPQTTLFAQLAKTYGLTISDSKYKSLQTQILGTSATASGSNAGPTVSNSVITGSAGNSSASSSSAGSNSTSNNSTGSNSTSNNSAG